MPEFIMNGKDAPDFAALDDFTQAYIEALFFTSCEGSTEAGTFDPENGSPLPDEAGFSDLAPEALREIVLDCEAFQKDYGRFWNPHLVDNPGKNDAQAGHDFWLTRNRHGAGFWDRPEIYGEPNAYLLTEAAQRFGECSVYLGDDSKIHIL